MIVYASTRKQVDKLYDSLRKKGYAVSRYHAGMEQEERVKAQNAFINDQTNIVVATNAFGMGIDKTDVRKVIHYNLPKDLESYYQEAGRAGRDSLEAEAILLYDAQDIMTNKFLIGRSSDELAEERLETMIQYANYTGCLRNHILQYFGEMRMEPCGNCSSCLGEVRTVDVTKEAQMVLSNMVRMKRHFGMTMNVDVLRGSRNQRVLENKFDELSTHGIMKNYSIQQIRDIISALVAHRYIAVTEYRGLYVTAQAKKLLLGEASLSIKERMYKGTSSSKTRQETLHVDNELYEALREVRFELAQAENVPAYIIFSNKSLEDMASKLPKNAEEFLAVEGVGTVKADKYAGQFLPVIQEFLAPKRKSQPITNLEDRDISSFSSQSKNPSYLESAEYAAQGLTPYEIAIERGITETTVLNHLMQAAEEGILEEFEADVSPTQKQSIKAAFHEVGTETLKPVKEALPEEITYEDIRYVLIEYLVKGN
jgi:ATP-dependent DNA helicase RecQ